MILVVDDPKTSGEVGELLGLTRQGVDYLAKTDPSFPAPVAVLSIGRVWEREDILRWARATGRLK
jgi:prophage regulatory protein